MHNYDFKNLNDKEFEVLANDLVSKKEGAIVDRFKPGKDGGVDGRFFTISGKEVIIQSKHWIKSGITALINRLEKDELPKVKKLNPDRYILVTSLGLSKANKSKIKAIFKPYIISEDDIIGQDNLNDWLSQNTDIEEKHYKLWLSSSAVLKIILNNALTGRSEAKRKEILDATNRYVYTDNFSRALEKLKKTNSVIITGEAGIGKTTLADQLALHYIAEGFTLCVIEDDITEAEAVFGKDEKQVFYFDDFLGRNYLTALQGHQDSHIVNFIKRVNSDKSKRFILSSRTTVLNQGKSLTDLFDINKMSNKEYEITISSLSEIDKAKILYNHIWLGNLDEAHIDEIYSGKRYLKIIRHKNYNPRLISFITDQDRFSDIPFESYWDHVLSTLQNPADVWANVFDNQIDDLMRLAVCLVVFNGEKIKGEDLREAFFAQALNDGLVITSNANDKFNRTVKNSVGAILNRTLINERQEVIFNLFNPSVADFVLARYLSDHKSLQEFFFHLNTQASIENLRNLHKSTSLTDRNLSRILDKLSSEKLNIKSLQENTAYTLKLIRLTTEQKGATTPSIYKSIVELTKNLNTIPILTSCIEEACIMLAQVIAHKNQLSFHKIAADFINLCLMEDLWHEDYEYLRELAGKLKPQLQATLVLDIKMKVEAFWQDQINDMIASDAPLDGYLDHRDGDAAFQKLQDYLYDKLSYFDFNEDEVFSLAEFADIEGQIEANQDAASHDDPHDYESWRGVRSHSGQGDDSKIDDLFDRS